MPAERRNSDIEQTHDRPLVERLVRDLLGRILPYPGMVKWAMRAASLVRPVSGPRDIWYCFLASQPKSDVKNRRNTPVERWQRPLVAGPGSLGTKIIYQFFEEMAKQANPPSCPRPHTLQL